MAALSIAIADAQKRKRSDRQRRAELCMDQVVKVAGIPDEFGKKDRAGNLAVERMFATLYQLVDSDKERSAVARAFLTWQEDERHETGIVRDLSAESVELLKSNHPLFIDGAYTPRDSNGAA